MQRLTEWNRDHTHAQVDPHANAIDKLAEYEDLEEQGFLPKLKVGDTVWAIEKDMSLMHKHIVLRHPEQRKIHSITISKKGILYHVKGESYSDKHFGKTVFLTRSEAEKALKSLEERE